MLFKKFLTLILIYMLLIPPTQGWSQKYEDQAQFYLQQIGPGQAAGQAPQRQAPSQTSQPQIRTELPPQGVTPPSPAQMLTSARASRKRFRMSKGEPGLIGCS